jgi:hypothetical protein
MKKSIATLMLCLLFSCFSNVGLADSSPATLQPVKQVHRGKRHHAHKATKHKQPKHPHHAV